MISVHKAQVLDGTTKHGTTSETTVVLKSRFSRAQFSLVRHDLNATFEMGLGLFQTTRFGRANVVSSLIDQLRSTIE